MNFLLLCFYPFLHHNLHRVAFACFYSIFTFLFVFDQKYLSKCSLAKSPHHNEIRYRFRLRFLPLTLVLHTTVISVIEALSVLRCQSQELFDLLDFLALNVIFIGREGTNDRSDRLAARFVGCWIRIFPIANISHLLRNRNQNIVSIYN